MKIKEIAFYDRPSERLIKYGAGVLSDYELLAIVLGKVKDASILEFTNKLLKKYNLNKIYDIGFEVLKKECNNDKVAALKILSLIQLCKRYGTLVNGGFNKKEIKSAKDIFDMFVNRVKDYNEEHLYVVCLDTKNCVNKVHRICIGTLNASLIHPREVFKAAIQWDSNSIILVHNHPSGDCSPSEEDIKITEKLVKIGEEMGIKVLDHIIVGKEKYWSWKE